MTHLLLLDHRSADRNVIESDTAFVTSRYVLAAGNPNFHPENLARTTQMFASTAQMNKLIFFSTLFAVALCQLGFLHEPLERTYVSHGVTSGGNVINHTNPYNATGLNHTRRHLEERQSPAIASNAVAGDASQITNLVGYYSATWNVPNIPGKRSARFYAQITMASVQNDWYLRCTLEYVPYQYPPGFVGPQSPNNPGTWDVIPCYTAGGSTYCASSAVPVVPGDTVYGRIQYSNAQWILYVQCQRTGTWVQYTLNAFSNPGGSVGHNINMQYADDCNSYPNAPYSTSIEFQNMLLQTTNGATFTPNWQSLISPNQCVTRTAIYNAQHCGVGWNSA